MQTIVLYTCFEKYFLYFAYKSCISDDYSIYNVTKTWSNGVRVGNVPDHKDKRKAKDNNQSWFPKTWTAKDIKRAGEHVASLKHNRNTPDGKAVFGVYKGVRVGVIRAKGRIATIFPDLDQSSVIKKGKKK